MGGKNISFKILFNEGKTQRERERGGGGGGGSPDDVSTHSSGVLFSWLVDWLVVICCYCLFHSAVVHGKIKQRPMQRKRNK